MRKLKVSTLIVACAVFALPLLPAQAAQDGNKTPFERLCSDRDRSVHEAKFAEWLAKRLDLNEAQKAGFKDFQAARAKALADSKAKLCASKPDLSTFEGRLVFEQTFQAARLEALKLENPKLIAFYKSLDARQQKKFDKIRAYLRHRRSR